MNKRIKKLWVDALRSGEYEQGTSQLRDVNNNFCCLGVLCNIYAQEHPEVAAKQKDQEKFMNRISLLPYAVVKWAGLLPVSDKIYSDDGVEYDIEIKEKSTNRFPDSISYLNDTGTTFWELAQLIGKQF